MGSTPLRAVFRERAKNGAKRRICPFWNFVPATYSSRTKQHLIAIIQLLEQSGPVLIHRSDQVTPNGQPTPEEPRNLRHARDGSGHSSRHIEVERHGLKQTRSLNLYSYGDPINPTFVYLDSVYVRMCGRRICLYNSGKAYKNGRL